MYVITEIIIEMVRMSCLREEYGEFMQWLCIFGVVIIIVDAIKWPHPVQVAINCPTPFMR